MSNEELAIKIKAGIDVPDNMLQLWQQTKDFIHTVAVHYQGYADVEELEQEGYLALYDAVDGFSPDQGCKFLTYAKYWMRLYMKRYIDNCCRPARIPSHEQAKIQEYRKMVNAFQVYLGRKPTEWEILHNMNMDSRQLKELERAMIISQIGSLDSSLEEGEDGDTLGDMVPGDVDVEESVTDRINQEQLQALIWSMVDRLPDRQPDVIRKRYQESMTLKEIGETYGVGIEAIRQSEREGLRRLRRSRDTWKLRAFLPEAIEGEAYRHNGVGEFNRTWESSTERVAMKLLENNGA